MNALLGTSTDHYDVLGLAPDASGDEIETAFDWLIRQKGYRFDVPLHRWPQRVQAIKAAYATIRDPAKRSIYDQSLRRASGSPLWPTTRTDAATDSLVRPAKLRQPPKASAKEFNIVGTNTGTDAATVSLTQPAKRRRPAKTAAKKASVVGAGSYAATHSSAVPTKPRQQPKKAAKKKSVKKAGVAAPAIVGSTVLHEAAAAETTHNQSANIGDVRNGVGRTTAEPPAEEFKPTGEERQASADMSEPSRAEADAPDHESAAWADGYPESDDQQRIPAKHLGAGAAVTVALGVILFASWQSEEPQSSRIDATQNTPAVATQGSPGAPLPETLPVIADIFSDSGEVLNPEEIAAALDDAAAASASLRDWAGADSPPASEIPRQQEVDGSAVVEGQAQSAAASAPPTSAAGPAAQTGSPPATESSATAPASAQANASGAATAPATAKVTPANVGTVVPWQPTVRTIASPLRWISGGPTDADNRRGRYRGTVVVQFTVGPEGRVTNCAAARSSGNSKLDATTCRILVERGRFTAARDAQGRPVVSQAHATYSWGRGRRPKS